MQEEIQELTDSNQFRNKESLGSIDNIVVVDIPLSQVKDFDVDPTKFKDFFLERFPANSEYFKAESEFAFRGARIGKSSVDAIKDNLKSDGIEFESNLDRPPGIYLQPGEKPDSYDRSVHFAFGRYYPGDGDYFIDPKIGDVGVFSVYKIKDAEELMVSAESVVYHGEGVSNKKYVPRDKEKTWNDLRVATVVFKII